MKATLQMAAPVTKPKVAKSGKYKILLVDDDPAIRQILGHLLADEDYFVLTAANDVEAVKLAAATKFDLLLLDLSMPIQDGWKTFKQLSTEHPLRPVILMTARPNEFFSALASGAGALLEKPLNFEKFFHTIKTLLEEPVEVHLARFTKRDSMFSYVPSKPQALMTAQELKTKSERKLT